MHCQFGVLILKGFKTSVCATVYVFLLLGPSSRQRYSLCIDILFDILSNSPSLINHRGVVIIITNFFGQNVFKSLFAIKLVRGICLP